MKKLLLMMITLPSMVFATGWSFGYADVNFDDIGLGGVYGSYDWEVGENMSVESGIIFGTKDYAENGSYGGVSYAALAELDPSVFVKAKYHVNDTFFANISLGQIAGTGTVWACYTTCLSESVSDSDTDIGLGFGIKFGSGQFTVDSIADTLVVAVGYNF